MPSTKDSAWHRKISGKGQLPLETPQSLRRSSGREASCCLPHMRPQITRLVRSRSCVKSPWWPCTPYSPSWMPAPWVGLRASPGSTCGASSPWTPSILTWGVTPPPVSSPTRCPPSTGEQRPEGAGPAGDVSATVYPCTSTRLCLRSCFPSV